MNKNNNKQFRINFNNRMNKKRMLSLRIKIKDLIFKKLKMLLQNNPLSFKKIQPQDINNLQINNNKQVITFKDDQ